jgi:hypothetical protein
MRHLSITEAKKGLSRLVKTEQTVTLTGRGQEVGHVRFFVTAAFDPVKAAAAAKRIRELGAKVIPSSKYGAAALVRKVRDGQ